MAQKILYLGNNSWCYTRECKQHAQLTSLQAEYRNSINDETARTQVIEELKNSTNGDSILLRLRVEELRAKLGRQPSVGLDLDGTVADFTGGLRRHMGEKFFIPKSEWESRFPDPEDYEYHLGSNPWFTDREHFMEEFTEAERNGLYRNLSTLGDPKTPLEKLREAGMNIIGTTARQEAYGADSLYWARTNRIPIERVLHTGPRKSHMQQVDVFIDDSPKVLNELFENGRPALIKSQKYNAHVDGGSLSSRIQEWSDEDAAKNIVELAFRDKDRQ